MPSLTISCMTKSPATSAVKVGITAAGFESVAVLPVGRLTNDHANVSGLPSTSVELEPFRVTRLEIATVWSGPALAVGGEFPVLMTTVSGVEFTVPSLTINCTMY